MTIIKSNIMVTLIQQTYDSFISVFILYCPSKSEGGSLRWLLGLMERMTAEALGAEVPDVLPRCPGVRALNGRWLTDSWTFLSVGPWRPKATPSGDRHKNRINHTTKANYLSRREIVDSNRERFWGGFSLVIVKNRKGLLCSVRVLAYWLKYLVANL